MRNPFVVFILLFFLSGCASLTESQQQVVKKYAEATQSYADYPGVLIKKYADVQEEIFLLKSPMTASTRIRKLHNEKKQLMEEAGRLDLSFKILKGYAKNLEVLATTDYVDNLTKSTNQMALNVDSLITLYNSSFDADMPKGLGKLTAQTIQFVGTRKLNQKRVKLIKEYIMKGDTLIAEFSKQGKAFIEEKVEKEWLQGIDDELKSAHQGVRTQFVSDTGRYASVSYDIMLIDKKVSELYYKIDELQDLCGKLKSSVGNLSKAHASVGKTIQKKKKVDILMKELITFINDANQLIGIAEMN